jgi:hypothetical protein
LQSSFFVHATPPTFVKLSAWWLSSDSIIDGPFF